MATRVYQDRGPTGKEQAHKLFALRELFLIHAHTARPIVFDLSDASTGDICIKPDEAEALDDITELDLPFRTCAFEVLGAPVLNTSGSLINSVIVHEIEPRAYAVWTHETHPVRGQMFGAHFERETETGRNSVKPALQYLLSRIRSGSISTEVGANLRARVGCGSTRRLIKIKQIVRVSAGKRRNESIKPIAGGSIDFSHRWEVMGHWRKVSGIGKDREGKYSVSGFTWVIPHVKGPEHIPLIAKTRLVGAPTAP